MPATVPMITVATTPPTEAHAGTTDGHALYSAYAEVRPIPTSTPPAPPSAASSSDSTRNWSRICPRVAPSERRSPISARRSSTEITIVLATPTPPTSNATAPSPSSRPLSVSLAACRAASASDGRVTLTSLGCSGLAVAASTAWTSVTASSRARVYTVVGYPSKDSRAAATGQPISAAVSNSGASGTGASTPTTVNHCPPSHTCTPVAPGPMPSRSAALAPSTTAGYADVAAFSQVP